jgi:hypothetical protein
MLFRIPLRPIATVIAIALSMFALSGTYTAAGQLGTGDVTVDLEVYTCPEGTDPATDRETLMATCLEPADPYSITIGDGQSWADGAETTGDAPQVVQFDEVPAGLVQLVQHVPDGMGEPVLFCSKGTAGETGEFVTPLNYELDSESFHLHALMQKMDAGATLTCQAFNFPTGIEASPVVPTDPGINLTFHACPAGTAVEPPFDALAGDCQIPIVGTAAMVSNGAGYMHTTGSVGTPNSAPELWIDGVPGGTLSILAGAGEEFEVGAIACGEVGSDLMQLTMNDDGAGVLEYEEGTTVLCHVFLVPPGSSATPVASPVP